MNVTPGRTMLAIRQRLAHGPRVAYWRDIVRPRILKTAPVAGTRDESCEIHVLTSREDWLNSIWALKSFYRASDRRYALCIHDDGTLDAAAEQLTAHFPDARLISREEADRAVLPALTEFPRCADFRRTNHLSPKLFDFRYFLRSDRMLLLDSDVLFFEKPRELLDRIENPLYFWNSVNRDVASAYTISPAAAREIHINLEEQFNSGLGLIHRDSLRLDWLEEFLGLPDMLGHFWRIEQTLFALLSSRYGVEMLPKEYNVRLDVNRHGGPVRHYVGAIRHLMYRDGMRRLVRNGMLEATP